MECLLYLLSLMIETNFFLTSQPLKKKFNGNSNTQLQCNTNTFLVTLYFKVSLFQCRDVGI